MLQLTSVFHPMGICCKNRSCCNGTTNAKFSHKPMQLLSEVVFFLVFSFSLDVIEAFLPAFFLRVFPAVNLIHTVVLLLSCSSMFVYIFLINITGTILIT